MTMQFTDTARNAAADAIETAIGVAPTLTIRTGTPPVTAGAAATGTVLATIVLASDWMTAASAGVKTLLGTAQDLAADATGRAGYFRITGGTQVWQGLVSEPYQASKAYAVGDNVHTGGNIYRASVAGTSGAASAPTGTGGSIADGGVTWAWVQAGTDMTIDNASLIVGQQVNVTALQLTVGGA
jgi:hypothetical protein